MFKSEFETEHCFLRCTDFLRCSTFDLKVKKYETELDSIKGENSAEEYEKLLRRCDQIFDELY